MAESEATLALVIKAKNLAGRELEGMGRGLKRAQGGVHALGGALKALMATGILALIAGAVAVVGALGGAAKAAADEEKGIKRMSAALKANVKGFKGNTDAIEAVIKKREELAFSDDDLRESLTMLVTKYKNVDKAQRIQAVAMDVARLKGISLKDATALVSKGMDGNAKILKQLGIELPKTATAQDRLTAIQKKAAGQAEAYGKTAQGAQESFGIAVQDLMEDIGQGLLPIMTEAFTWLRTEGIPAVRRIIGAIGDWINKNQPLIDTIKKIVGQIVDRLKPVLASIADFITKTLIPAISNFIGWLWGDGKGPLPTAFNAISGFIDHVLVPAFNGIVQIVKDVVDWIGKAIDAIGKFLKMTPEAQAQVQNLAGTTSGYLNSGVNPNIGHHAAGGWAGLHGPELSWLGEKGPEYVVPNSQLKAAGGGVTIQGVTERELLDMVDRGLYFRLRRAGVA